jgi:signal transduction histidine kinase
MVFIVLVVLYRNNQRKQKLNKELEMINETKDRFFSIISHDLRGPISAFYGISRMIRMFIGKQQYKRLEEMTEQIDHSVSSISSLLDNLLSWAVQKQGQFPYHPEHIQLHQMTENLKYLFQNQAESKNIEINFKIQPSFYLYVDKNSAMTIFRNLISNALKFTQEGGLVTVSAYYEDDFIAIRFTDTGMGMNKEKVDTLFKSQVQSTYGTSGEKGVGLGLQLVFDFVQLNHGNIEVGSEENVGTTFIVRLPRGEKQDQSLDEKENVVVEK